MSRRKSWNKRLLQCSRVLKNAERIPAACFCVVVATGFNAAAF